MKIKYVIFIVLVMMAIQSCHRAMSPYEAANKPRGKKCREIK